MTSFTLNTQARFEMIDITERVADLVRKSGIGRGLCHVFVPHTTAAVTINESADPAVRSDILKALARSVPADAGYGHSEGNSDSHVKSSLFGVSLTLVFHDRRLMLGQWQAVYFCEFDGPRTRKVILHVVPE